jgi:hypothetical protein
VTILSKRPSFEDWPAIQQVLNSYARMVDLRECRLADEIFTPNVRGTYSVGEIFGRAALIAHFRTRLDGCGPTQHLLGNYVIEVRRDKASAACDVRMFHQRAGPRANLEPYEGYGTYYDLLVKTPDGWRIEERELKVRMTRGDRGVLQPA